MQRVVVIIELHHSSHEGVVGVANLLNIAIFVVLDRDHHRLLQHVGRLDNAISKELSEVLHFLDSDEFLINLGAGLDIWVACTLRDSVADLFTTGASDILIRRLLVVLLLIGHVLILIIFALVLAILAAELVLALATTAPPHLATVVTLMHPTTPIEVLFLIVLLAAVFARLEPTVEFALSLDQLLNPQLRLLLLHGELLARLLKIYDLFAILVVFFCHLGQLLLQLDFSILGCSLVEGVVLLNLLLVLVKLSSVASERVPLLQHLALLVPHIFDLIGQLLIGLTQQLDLPIHLVTQSLVTRNVLNRLMQNRELFL